MYPCYQLINQPKIQDQGVIASFTPDALVKVWEELAYRLDMWRVTSGAQINICRKSYLCSFSFKVSFIQL